jgi:ABC-type antimicrobial peptide transport system permease subunit
VVEDVMLADFREQEPEPLLYVPLVGATQRSWVVGTPAYVVKTSRVDAIGADVRALAREVAPEAPVYRVFTMAGLAARSMAQLSFTMLTLALAAGLALVLGAVGLYGTLSYVVSQRTREIGVRMALGASAPLVRGMVVRQGLVLAGVGVVIGLIAAGALSNLMSSLLFGVSAIDPITYGSVSVAMVVVALAASWIPARRAAGVDPSRALRQE